MNLRHRINLIPRNNWDFGFTPLFLSLSGVFQKPQQTASFTEHLPQKPIWTNSGRTSLFAILKALELPANSKVGVPLFCCSVVFNAICQAGLRPQFIDSNINDCNISVEDLQKKRGDLAALVVVHMFGNPCDLDAITAVTDHLPIIEDCAQSLFSFYKGKPTGSLTTASFFSFRCGKYISAGEGSAILVQDSQLGKKIENVVEMFRAPSPAKMFGQSLFTFLKAALYHRPWYGLLGYPVGMRLDKKLNLTSKDGFETGQIASTHLALIRSRIPQFKEKVELQRAHAEMLLEMVESKRLSVPSVQKGCDCNWFQFPLRFQNQTHRDRMADHLLDHGIDTAKYLDNCAEEARANNGYGGDCPNAELLSKTVLLVPIHYNLQDKDIYHIARTINEGSRNL